MRRHFALPGVGVAVIAIAIDLRKFTTVPTKKHQVGRYLKKYSTTIRGL